MSESLHPCQSCGACCASFRVEFYWREGNSEDHQPAVPEEHWEEGGLQTRIMKGTNKNHQIRCVALKGRVGQSVSCGIYSSRSSTCRNFMASYENGYRNPRCDEARRKHGLAPLTKNDFENLIQEKSPFWTL